MSTEPPVSERQRARSGANVGRRATSSVRAVLAVGLAAGLTLLSACGGGGGGPLGGGSGPSPADTIRIGSADFPESALLADIYSVALQAKGITTERRSLGSRETYIPALRDGSIDLIPEYTGTLLQYFDQQATPTASAEVYAALKTAVPAPLTVLEMAAAEDKDAVVVTRELAARYNARTIADLAPGCRELVFGGPSEFQTRPDGIPGLRERYGCEFKSYVKLDTGGPVTVRALKDDTVQAADLFTTNPALEENGLVVLEDPKNNFAAQNVVPLINSTKATEGITQTLNAISAKLTTEGLVELNRKLNAPDKPNSEVVAKEWLSANGLG